MSESEKKNICQRPLAAGLYVFNGTAQRSIQTYTTQTSLNFPPTFLALRGCHVRHYFARRFLFLNAL
jgi:hypothetical protein